MPHIIADVRTRWLLWPREHGAWGMLLVPLVTGAWVAGPRAGNSPALILFTLVSLALFCLRTPMEVWLGASSLKARTSAERRAVIAGMLFYGSVAVLAVALLLRIVPAKDLLLLAAVVAVAALVQAPLRKVRGQSRRIAQMVGAFGLTSTAAGAYYVVTGQLDWRALLLWAMNWMFAVNQIAFVHLRVHAAQAGTRAEKFRYGRGFLSWQGLMVLFAAVGWRRGALPALALSAFAPVLLRGLLWFILEPKPLEIRRLGKSELFHALLFGALLIVGFHR